MRKTLLVLSLPLLLCTLAHAASFDCTKAKTAQEKAICGSPALERSRRSDGRRLSKHGWPRRSRTGLPGFARTRSSGCARATQVARAGDADEPLAACLSDVYKGRIDELQGMVQHIGGRDVCFAGDHVDRARRSRTPLPSWATEVTPGFGTLQATWPQASSTTPQWTAWNQAIVPAVIQAANCRRGQPAPRTGAALCNPASIQADRSPSNALQREDGFRRRLSISTTATAPIQSENSAEFYWMLGEQRALKPEDVFLPNSGWDAWMEKRLDSYLQQALDSNRELPTAVQACAQTCRASSPIQQTGSSMPKASRSSFSRTRWPATPARPSP